MTDSMNFGPEWLRNLSDGSTAGINSGGARYQLAEYRYGREEMLALYEKGQPAPNSLCTFSPLYSEQALPPLALSTEEERQWTARGPPMGPSVRGGRGAIGPERGGRIARGGRGSYQPYGRNVNYETGGGWGNGEQTEWSPRKEFNYSRSSAGGVDNWRRTSRSEEDDGWRANAHQGGGGGRGGSAEKWSRQSSWREGDVERVPGDKSDKGWHDVQRGPPGRRMWGDEDHLPEWATENLGEGGGTFDASGAFHGSDDEQDPKGNLRKDHHLQKSVSQQNLPSKNQHPPLSTSKSALSLSKSPEGLHNNKKDEIKENHIEVENLRIPEEIKAVKAEEPKEVMRPVMENKPLISHDEISRRNHNQNSNMDDTGNSRDEDFDKLQEDLVLKLVVDEEPTGSASAPHVAQSNGVQPPPSMMGPQIQEKWFYQDPQGDLQGPFLSTEMAEWFRAGYFSTTLYVRRHCDERFYTLGELVRMCSGDNPFLSTVPIPPRKQENKVPDEVLQYQLMQTHLASLRATQAYSQEPWNALNVIQQRELMAQQLLAQQQQLQPEPYMQQPPAANPILHVLNQLQQVKMPVPPPVVDKPQNIIPSQLDPLQALVQQMGGLQNLQNRMQPPVNMGTQGGMKHEPSSLHGLPVNGIPGPNLPGLQANNLMQQKPGLSKMDGDNNMNFLQFLQKPSMEQSIDLESLWKNQYAASQQKSNVPPPAQSQWQQSDKPISMWDMPTPPNHAGTPPEVHQMNKENTNITKEKQLQDISKEEKKRKELEEKQAKKEAEEKRKLEQKKQEAEKKLLEEKRKKEEERIKRELEKAKKDAEEKRQRELAEKRRLKEQRKAEEEARKKADELRKMEEQEREKLAAKEREEQAKKQAEYTKQAAQKLSKAAPWSQPVSNQGLSLGEIQKLERERKAEQVALMQQQRLQHQLQELTSPEKPTSIANWVNKPIKQSCVKSLAEIQAEEQERLLKVKQAQEKLMQQKEKETLSPPTSGIWSGQSLTWTNNDTNAGFWEEPPQQQRVVHKPTNAMSDKVVKQNANNAPKVVNKAPKPKPKKDENVNNNSASTDEFADWCSKTLANMNTQVDIPTFVSFLRDIESALDVREYCRDYLGDKPATQQFAAQFLEKRRLYKPKVTTHKDDMCSPAPAITPSTQHNNTDFQEVKGKGKKCKKSKMLKVDARILGFNVTAAQDRINVGDRDYGDTT